MRKDGGRSSALDRAQALLSAKRSGGSREHTEAVGGSVRGSVRGRAAPADTHSFLSDLSDLSSLSPPPQQEAQPAAKDFRPESRLGGGGSRFLKKAPPPAADSRRSPVSRSRAQQGLEPRGVSSSQPGSQAAALSRLAQIESRIRSHRQARLGPKPAEDPALGSVIYPPSQSQEASAQHSTQSSSDQSPKGKRFLKSKTAVSVDSGRAAASSPKGPRAAVRPRSRAADATAPPEGSEQQSVRVVRGVSLESDEEDMRMLLGDSLDSADNSFLKPGRPSSNRTSDKMLSQSSQKALFTPPPAAAPHSPASPHRSSPFRFTGQAQAHFSPSVLSPSSSPPCVSPAPLGSPQRSLSSMSGRSEVLSLEELFPVGPRSEDPHSEMSTVSSEDFKINVMTLDDLVPATFRLTEEMSGKEREAEHNNLVPGSPNRCQNLQGGKEKEEDGQEGDVLDYQSDFESGSRTESEYSASQISEDVQGHGGEEDVVSEVRSEASDSDTPRGRTEDDHSSTFSDTIRSYSSRTSDRSRTLSRSRMSGSSRSSVSHSSRSSSQQSRRRASTRKVSKEAAVQTQPDPLAYTWSSGVAALGPAVGKAYVDPTPVVFNALSAETVEVLSTFNPAVFALNEVLKQQLAALRRFIESSRHLHSSLVRSLEPPNYRYTTLEDTKEYIRKRRPPTLRMEDALEEVLQEMRDMHHI